MEFLTLLLALGFVIQMVAAAVALEEGIDRASRADHGQLVRDDPARPR